MTCRSCGFENLPEARFCSGCGIALNSGVGQPREGGERRQITTLFCDMVGSTALSQRMDPEDLQDIIAQYHSLCSEIVQRHGGHVSQYLGDGVLIFFGFPHSREDDARRAVECSLEILHSIGMIDAPCLQGNPLSKVASGIQIRIGVHTGRVVFASTGQAWMQQNLAHGDVVNIAARIQGFAEPGVILISDDTWRIVGGFFEGEAIENVSLKGVLQPMRLWRLQGRSLSASRLDAEQRLTDYVGRHSELTELRKHWHAVREGNSRFVVISGEAGIGKSRLALEFLRQIAAEDQDKHEIRCQEEMQNTAFYPVIDLIRIRLGLNSPRLGDEQRLQRIEEWLRSAGIDGDEAIPLMANLLGIAWERYLPAPALTPARQRLRTLEILRDALVALSESRPTIFLVEDLHWADPSTRELLDALVVSKPAVPMMGLLTARPHGQLSWSFDETTSLLSVSPLEGQEVEAITRNVAHGKAIPAAVIRQITRHCDGIPLFVEEVARSVIDAGIMEERDHSWILLEPIPEGLIPASIDALLTARIDRLGESRQVLQVAAAIGREFDMGLLVEVVDRDQQELETHLHQILESGLVRKASSGVNSRFAFKHALVHTAAYESLLLKVRRKYHDRIADILLQRLDRKHSDHQYIGGKPEVLAHHLSSAGRHMQAAEFWSKAGQYALLRMAVPEAHGHFSFGLKGLRSLPESKDLLHRELELQLAIAPTLMTVHGWAAPSVAEACRRAQELCHRLERTDQLYPAIWGLWTNQFVAGSLDEALQTAGQALTMAQEAQVGVLQVSARHAMAYSHYYRGEWNEALHHAELGLALYSLDQEKELTMAFQISSSVNLCAARGSSLWMLGHQRRGLEQIDSMIDMARSIGHPSALSNALGVACYMLTFANDFPRMLRHASEVRSFAREDGWELWYSVGVLSAGWAKLRLGDREAGLRDLFEGVELFWRTDSGLMGPTIGVIHAEGLCAAGRPHEALAMLSTTSEAARQGKVGVLLPEVHRLMGRILLEGGDADAAEAEFLEALALARGQGALSLELRAALALAALRQRRGVDPHDDPLLADCIGRFPHDSDAAELNDARRLLHRTPLSGKR